MGIGAPTLVWYVVATLLFVFGWKAAGRVTIEWLAVLIRLGLMTLLSPGIFLETGASDSVLLPVLICIAKYAPSSDAILYSPSHRSPFVLPASGLAFWPTPVVWFVAALAMLVYEWWRIVGKKDRQISLDGRS
jgi:hypothetical protein